jgi:hypothetical protein
LWVTPECFVEVERSATSSTRSASSFGADPQEEITDIDAKRVHERRVIDCELPKKCTFVQIGRDSPRLLRRSLLDVHHCAHPRVDAALELVHPAGKSLDRQSITGRQDNGRH